MELNFSCCRLSFHVVFSSRCFTNEISYYDSVFSLQRIERFFVRSLLLLLLGIVIFITHTRIHSRRFIFVDFSNLYGTAKKNKMIAMNSRMRDTAPWEIEQLLNGGMWMRVFLFWLFRMRFFEYFLLFRSILRSLRYIYMLSTDDSECLQKWRIKKGAPDSVWERATEKNNIHSGKLDVVPFERNNFTISFIVPFTLRPKCMSQPAQ